MLETQRLTEERQLPAAANIVLSVVLGLGAAMAGQWIESAMNDDRLKLMLSGNGNAPTGGSSPRRSWTCTVNTKSPPA